MVSRDWQHSDIDTLNSWLKARGHAVLEASFYPPTGRIVEDVAVGFLYLTASTVAFMECFTTNPAARSKDRHKALLLIMEDLFRQAKYLGVKRVVGFSEDSGILRRAVEQFGCASFGARIMLGKEL